MDKEFEAQTEAAREWSEALARALRQVLGRGEASLVVRYLQMVALQASFARGRTAEEMAFVEGQRYLAKVLLAPLNPKLLGGE